jgi:hypothetical protein
MAVTQGPGARRRRPIEGAVGSHLHVARSRVYEECV